jgi:signal transduction histidine kinase
VDWIADEEKHMNHGLRAPGHNAEPRPREPVPAQGTAEQIEVVRQESRSKSLAEFRLLAASMAHEIRNSLAGVRGAIRVLEGNYVEPSERLCHVFKEILRRLDGVNNMVGDLLEYKTVGREEGGPASDRVSGRCSFRAFDRYAAAVHQDGQGVSL